MLQDMTSLTYNFFSLFIIKTSVSIQQLLQNNHWRCGTGFLDAGCHSVHALLVTQPTA